MTERVREILNGYGADNPGTLTNLARLLNTGRLAGTGKLVIQPVDQGFEHGPGRSFAPNPPSGCVFHPRCHHPAKDAACAAIVPPLEEKTPGHFAACIKQPPTIVSWEQQKESGGVHPPERYLPLAAVHA
jgi:hypothetical protein